MFNFHIEVAPLVLIIRNKAQHFSFNPTCRHSLRIRDTFKFKFDFKSFLLRECTKFQLFCNRLFISIQFSAGKSKRSTLICENVLKLKGKREFN